MAEVVYPARVGYLQKRGQLNKAFQKRFFRLKDGSLKYYKKETDSNEVGEIPLAPGWTVTIENDLLMLKPPTEEERTYILMTDSASERRYWERDIQKTLLLMSEKPSSTQEVTTEKIDNHTKTPSSAGLHTSHESRKVELVEEQQSTQASSGQQSTIAKIFDSSSYLRLQEDIEEIETNSAIPFRVLVILVFILSIALLSLILSLIFTEGFWQVLGVILFALLVLFFCISIKGAVIAWFLFRELDKISKDRMYKRKTVQQCQAEAIELYEKYVDYLSVDEIIFIFTKTIRYTADGTKWSFIREETGLLSVALKYGSTETFQKIIRLLQQVVRDKVESKILTFQMQMKVKTLLEYNPSRFGLD